MRPFLSLVFLVSETSWSFRHFLTCDTLLKFPDFIPRVGSFQKILFLETWWRFQKQKPWEVSQKTGNWKLVGDSRARNPVKKPGNWKLVGDSRFRKPVNKPGNP
jgi:hypothetical protein